MRERREEKIVDNMERDMAIAVAQKTNNLGSDPEIDNYLFEEDIAH